MTHDDVQLWLDRYIAAWSSYDASAIGDLFAEDAEYRYHPWDEHRSHGREAIVAQLAVGQGRAGLVGGPLRRLGVRRRTRRRRSARAATRTPTARSGRSTTTTGAALRRHGSCVEFVEYFMELPERLREGR